MKESCGYLGHVCSATRVQFISRYDNQSDYCVAGERVTLRDKEDGTTVMVRGNYAQFQALRLHLIEEYGKYIRWHVEFKAKHDGSMRLQPFVPCYY